MRISEARREKVVRELKTRFGQHAGIVLFGSRAVDHKRGGDVDIYVEAGEVPKGGRAMAEIEASLALEDILEGARVDLVVRYPDEPERPIHTIAQKSGVPL